MYVAFCRSWWCLAAVSAHPFIFFNSPATFLNYLLVENMMIFLHTLPTNTNIFYFIFTLFGIKLLIYIIITGFSYLKFFCHRLSPSLITIAYRHRLSPFYFTIIFPHVLGLYIMLIYREELWKNKKIEVSKKEKSQYHR
jgi:hypothetical protein